MPMRWTAQRKRRPPALRLPMQTLVSWIAETGRDATKGRGLATLSPQAAQV